MRVAKHYDPQGSGLVDRNQKGTQTTNATATSTCSIWKMRRDRTECFLEVTERVLTGGSQIKIRQQKSNAE